MDIGGKSLNFLDLCITIKGKVLATSVFSKPTDAHSYFNAKSCHHRSQILGVPKGAALRIGRICSEKNDFFIKSKEYANYLMACGHDKQHVRNNFDEVATMTREEARKRRKKRIKICAFFRPNLIPEAQILGKS